MGLRYTLYRIFHEAEKRIGVLKLRHPATPANRHFYSLEQWRSNTPLFVIDSRESLDKAGFGLEKRDDINLKDSVSRILEGEILFFSSEWIKLGVNYDWLTNPSNGFHYTADKHWSKIPDLSSSSGDIKYVWEKSRFTWVLTIIRNDFHNNEDHSEYVFAQIENWIDANPINLGPNWRCSQEISLRILNWCYALHFYKNSGSLTEERWNKLQNVIYWSLHHVFHHINFSRIAVRNNHAITETLFVAMSEILFPFIPETAKWSRNGLKWFEQEIDYQIYEDGTFLQYSMNYHRVVVQLLSLGVSLTSIAGKSFSAHVYKKAFKSVNFLFQCTEDQNGYLPNFGPNDGAWFFPLSSSDYRDFRPQLNSLHKLLTNEYLYTDKILIEDCYWMGNQLAIASSSLKFKKIEKQYGVIKFNNGGYYLFREGSDLTFIKCGSYVNRPTHADNLHIDIWYNGKNILHDGGSFKYNNTNIKTSKYYSGTESHNSVMIGDYDQMLSGPRFMWFNWTKAIKVNIFETNDEYVFEGSIKAFTYLDNKILHNRRIYKQKGVPVWTIKDEIIHKPNKLTTRQIWHTKYNNVYFESYNSERIEKNGYYSLYYGVQSKCKQIEFCTNSNIIETTITIK